MQIQTSLPSVLNNTPTPKNMNKCETFEFSRSSLNWIILDLNKGLMGLLFGTILSQNIPQDKCIVLLLNELKLQKFQTSSYFFIYIIFWFFFLRFFFFNKLKICDVSPFLGWIHAPNLDLTILYVCVVCVGSFTPSNQAPLTKEDNRVLVWWKVPSWKVCTKPIRAVAKKLRYKQKRDNKRSLIAGVFTLVCVSECELF